MIQAGNWFPLPSFRISVAAEALMIKVSDPFRCSACCQLGNPSDQLGILQRKLMIKDRASPSLNREGAEYSGVSSGLSTLIISCPGLSREKRTERTLPCQNGSTWGKLGFESQSESRFFNSETAHPGLNLQNSQKISGGLEMLRRKRI